MNKYIQNPDIIIIGAGAAGLLAAITAAKAGLKTIVLEKMQRPARKLRITGKGRCNITNSAPLNEFLPHFGANSDFLQQAFNNFFAPDIMRLLEKTGVELVTERGGRVFPTSGKAAQVVDALVYAAESAGAKIICNHPVRNLIINNNIITGVQCAAETFHAPNIILATGGKSYPATGSDGDGYRLARQAGHTIITPLPALVPLVSSDPAIPKLNGLNLRNVRAKLFANDIQIDEQFGEMTFAEYGLTGPIILTASGIAVLHLPFGDKLTICIDHKPPLSPQKLSNGLQRDLQ
jgi:predicted Rossmann fold flavoprotein